MRVMVLFDLPVGTAAERKEYARFRKFLVRSGFVMMQESVYTKIVLTPAAAAAAIRHIRDASPPGRQPRGRAHSGAYRDGEAIRRNGAHHREPAEGNC